MVGGFVQTSPQVGAIATPQYVSSDPHKINVGAFTVVGDN